MAKKHQVVMGTYKFHLIHCINPGKYEWDVNPGTARQNSLFALTCCILLLSGLYLSGCRNETLIHPERRQIIEAVYASGRIVPEHETAVISFVGGILKKSLVNSNDSVKTDQHIFIIKPESSIYGASIPAITTLSVDPKVLSLLNSISQNATNLQEPNKSISPASGSLSGKMPDKITFRSPAEGRVFQTLKKEGDAIRPGEILAFIGHPKKRIIQLSVDQKDILKIMKGQKVLLTDDLHPGVIYEGTITGTYPVLNESNLTFRVDAIFNSEYPAADFIHMPVEGNIIIRENPDALVITRKALCAPDSVWVKEGGKTNKIFIRKGIETMDYVEIKEGLTENSLIVVPAKKD
jgi:HlyD family secretion protein